MCDAERPQPCRRDAATASARALRHRRGSAPPRGRVASPAVACRASADNVARGPISINSAGDRRAARPPPDRTAPAAAGARPSSAGSVPARRSATRRSPSTGSESSARAASCRRAAAPAAQSTGSIIGEWKACEVTSLRRRRLPPRARPRERRWPRGGPATTQRPGAFSAAMHHAVGQPRRQLLGGQPHRQHAARRQQPAFGDRARGPAPARRRAASPRRSRRRPIRPTLWPISARRLDAPAHPQSRERVLEAEDRRLSDAGRQPAPRIVGEELARGSLARSRCEDGAALVVRGAERRFGLVQPAAHAGVLRALAGADEPDVRQLRADLRAPAAAGIRCVQQFRRLGDAVAATT